MMKQIYDVTYPVSAALAAWPGDAPYRFDWSMTQAGGASVNVGQVSMSVHTGTHVDAPYHFDPHGSTADQLPLHALVGRAIVVEVREKHWIRRGHLEGFNLRLAPRVLFRTDAWLDRTQFPCSIPVMESGLPDWFHEKGVVLVGVDVPSVDAIESKDLPNHHRLGNHGIVILEGLHLIDVPPGTYELAALPLKLVGADGAPARAILRAV